MCPGRRLGSQEGISTSWCPAAANPEHAASWQLPVPLRPCRDLPTDGDVLGMPQGRAAAGTEGTPESGEG